MKTSLLIFGDSYSTFEGLVPEGYAVYYYHKGRPETDVTRPEETWWHQVITKKGYHLVRNDSWSGATIGYTGYDGADLSETSSFLCRLDRLVREGFFAQNRIDTVFVFGGTNDSWSDAPLGEYKLDGIEEGDLYCVLPAVCRLAKRLKETFPHAAVVLIGNCDIKDEITDAMSRASAHYGHCYVPLSGIDKINGHPTEIGMEQICTQILAALEKK